MLIGAKLKELRIQRQANLKTVAEYVGVTFQQISKWEKDETRPQYENLVALADFYDVSTDYLLGREK